MKIFKSSIKISLISLLFLSYAAFSQTVDSTQTLSFFRGQITATNNGVSLIPSFSLGRPALLFDLSVGKGRLSFDPMLRFGMDAKPWAFILWWRYKLVQQRKFNVGIGAHPSFVFRDVALQNNGETKNYLTTQRYFAYEFSPSYTVNKYFNVGLYYLGGMGLTKDVIQRTYFVAFRTGFNVDLSKKITLGFIPQAYFLKMDKQSGTYVNTTFNVYKKQFPVSFNAVVSQAINTNITGKTFLWSVGAVYNINSLYYKK